MGTTLLYIVCQMGHYYGCVKFDFNDILFYTKNNFEQRLSIKVSTYITIVIFNENLFFDIDIKVIYFTFRIIVDQYFFISI